MVKKDNDEFSSLIINKYKSKDKLDSDMSIINYAKLDMSNNNKRYYNNLENIISDSKINFSDNIKSILSTYNQNNDSISNIIYNPDSLYNNKKISIEKEDIYSIIKDYNSQGFNTIIRDKKIYIPSEKPFDFTSEQPQQPVQSQVTSVPSEYEALMATMRSSFAQLEFRGVTSLANASQNRVDILTFSFVENGEVKTINVVAKDASKADIALPEFLKSKGIATHSIYDTSSSIFMQQVGINDLRDIVLTGSDADVLRASNLAMDKIAQVHETATNGLAELDVKYGLKLEVTDYVSQFKQKVLAPLSNGRIVSIQEHQFLKAYSQFARFFTANEFVHGDFHTRNIRVNSNDAFVIDYEWSRIGSSTEDIARFVNSVVADKPNTDVEEFSRLINSRYNQAKADYSGKLNSDNLQVSLTFGMIKDAISKVGEYVAFGNSRPQLLDEKLEKGARSLRHAVNLMNSAVANAQKSGNYNAAMVIDNLRQSTINYFKIAPYARLNEEAKELEKTPIKVVPVSYSIAA